MHTFLKSMLISLAAVLLAAGSGWAQVAAPRLAPFGVGDTALNPATQQWGAPSFAGIAAGTGTTKETSGGTKVGDGDSNAQAAQVRLVGEYLSVGAQGLHSDSDISGSAGKFEFREDDVQVALAGRLGSVLALGVGQDQRRITEKATAPGLATERTTTYTLPVGGVSVRLGEVFFLGVSGGSEKAEVDFAGIKHDSHRNVRRAGAGYRWGMGGNALHLEYYREERDPFDTVDVITGTPMRAGETTRDAYVAEAMFHNILLGYENRATEEKAGGIKASESSEDLVTLGWVPMQGLALVLLHSAQEQKNVAVSPTSKTTLDLNAVSLAWQF